MLRADRPRSSGNVSHRPPRRYRHLEGGPPTSVGRISTRRASSSSWIGPTPGTTSSWSRASGGGGHARPQIGGPDSPVPGLAWRGGMPKNSRDPGTHEIWWTGGPNPRGRARPARTSNGRVVWDQIGGRAFSRVAGSPRRRDGFGSRAGRTRPRDFMRDATVLGCMPSIRAAPLSPAIFQRATSRARRRLSRSKASSSWIVRTRASGSRVSVARTGCRALRGSARSRLRRPSVAVMTTRSMTF